MNELDLGTKVELEILDRVFKSKDNKALATLIATEKIKDDPDYYSNIILIKEYSDFLKMQFEFDSFMDIQQLIRYIELVQNRIKKGYMGNRNLVFREILNDELKKIQYTLNRLKIQVDIFDSDG